MKSRLGACLLVAAATSLSACRPAPKTKGQGPVPVRVAEVESSALAAGTSYAGEVVPRVETQLAFLIPGRVERRFVNIGDRVRAGQVLAQLETADYRIAASSASALLAQTRAELGQSTTDLDRSTRLLDSGAVPRATFDQRQTSAEAARARFDQAKSGVDRSARDLANTSLRSPVNGVVTSVTVEAGQIVNPGQAMIRVASSDTTEVAIDIPEARIGQVHPGSAAVVRLWVDSAEAYAVHVREVSPQSDPVTRTYRVKLTFDKPDDRVHFGMSARVAFEGSETPTFVVPLSALFEQGGHPSVWIFDASKGHVAARELKVDRYVDGKAIVSGGLNPGEKIVTAGAHRLDPKLDVVAWAGLP